MRLYLRHVSVDTSGLGPHKERPTLQNPEIYVGIARDWDGPIPKNPKTLDLGDPFNENHMARQLDADTDSTLIRNLSQRLNEPESTFVGMDVFGLIHFLKPNVDTFKISWRPTPNRRRTVLIAPARAYDRQKVALVRRGQA